MQKTYLTLIAIFSAALLLSACETPGTKPSEETEGTVIGEETTTQPIEVVEIEAGDDINDLAPEATETFVLSDCEPDCDYPKSALNNPESMLAKRLVFFTFDSDSIPAEYNNTLIAHGKYLASNPEVKVRLEGHTDERGTREYNLALSEKRAQSVRRFLMLYGARSESIGVYGFGEELPLALGNNETAWSENRRVELVYDANN